MNELTEFYTPIIIMSMFMQDEKVRLNHICDEVIKIQNDKSVTVAAAVLYDKLFTHFFSTCRSKYSSKDVHCFMKIVTDQGSHLSQSILACYMKQILKFNECERMGMNTKVHMLWR